MNNQTAIILGNYQWDVTSPGLINIKDNNVQKKLTKKQYLLMSCLYRAYPNSVSNQDIIHDVWKTEHVSNESLPQLIIRTRNTLDDKEKNIIVNQPGEGYSLHISTIDEKKTEQTDTTPAIKSSPKSIWKCSLWISCLLLTVINLYYFFEAYQDKKGLIEVFTAETYSHIEPIKESGDLSITIEGTKCKFEAKHHAINCK